MRSPLVRPTITQGYVCPRCRLATQCRAISTTFLEKKAEGQRQWADRAREIRAGERQSMLSILESRGYVQQVTGERHDLDQLMINKRIGAYCGVDPTAPSLHIGHLLPLMTLFWMHVHGFHTVSLIGAATSRIGDPTGRSKDRPEMTNTERKANIVGIHYQMKKLWTNMETIAARHGFQWEKYWHRDIVNNATWWNNTPFVDVIKYLGKGLRIGEMLKRDTVKNKMDSGDGVSFAEFCYPIMQGWDWWYLYDTKKIQMQIGGSDQFGNIVAGVDAVKWMAKTHPDPDIRQERGVKPLTTPVGLTVPLLTTSTGEKFGKSAGNAIWLDSNMTGLFDLYAFFVRTADADVERFLKLFTFMPLTKIQSIMDQHKNDTSKRLAQHTLANEILQLVHGPANAKFARDQYEKQSSSRKSITLSSLVSASDLQTAAKETEQPAQDPASGNPECASNGSSSDEIPSHFSRDAFNPPKAPRNILSENQSPGTRQRSFFTSPILNKFAPAADPNAPSGASAYIVLPASLIREQSIAKVLYSAGLVTSRSEGHRLAQNQGAYIGRQSSGHKTMSDEVDFVPAKLQDPHLTWDNIIRDHDKSGLMDKEGEEGLLILRSGKWKIRVIRVVSDEKFETLGLPDPPLWQEHKSVLAQQRAEDATDVAGWRGKSTNRAKKDAEAELAQIADEHSVAVEDLDSLTEFVEPETPIHRRDAEVAYREQSKQGLKYLQNRALHEGSDQTASAITVRRIKELRDIIQNPRLPTVNRGRRDANNNHTEARKHDSQPGYEAWERAYTKVEEKRDRDAGKKKEDIHPAEARKRHAIKMSLLAEARFRGNQKVLDEMRDEARVARESEMERMDRMRLRDEIREEMAKERARKAEQRSHSQSDPNDDVAGVDDAGELDIQEFGASDKSAQKHERTSRVNPVETLLQAKAQDDFTRRRMGRVERGFGEISRGVGTFGAGWRKSGGN